jgi:hypothetical protein
MNINDLITIFILGMIVVDVSAQELPCPAKTITTDPRNNFSNAINDEVPSKRNNFFDWTNAVYNINVNTINRTDVQSPFYQGNTNDNVWALTLNKDMSPDDGWELIHHNLGFNDDGTPRVFKPDFAHVVLYNRYTGLMRIFMCGYKPGYNGASIQISFANGSKFYSSLISNAAEIFALDKFQPNPSILGITRYLNSTDGAWFYGDFQTTYDPCTCQQESYLYITMKLISEADIKISGSFTGTIASLTNNQGSVAESGHTLKELTAAGTKASKSFKTFSDFVDEQLKSIGTAGKTSAEIQKEKDEKRKTLTDFQEQLKDSRALKGILQSIPYLGAGLEFISFFTGGAKKGGPMAVEIMPMSINATIDLSGTMTTNDPQVDIHFATPGSAKAATHTDDLYPYYNQVLGVFNLLYTPKMYYKNHSSVNTVMGVRYNKLYQLDYSTLNMVLNPASKFKMSDYEILADLVFKGGGGRIETGFVPITSIGSFANLLPGWWQGDEFEDGVPFNWDEVELKLLLRLVRQDDGPNVQNGAILMSFPVELISNSTFTYSPTVANFLDIGSSPDNVYFRNIGLAGQTFQNYNLSTWNGSIKITNSKLKPNTSFKIVSRQFENFSAFKPLSTPLEIASFCDNAIYKLNPSRTLMSGGRAATETHKLVQSEVESELFVHPNPGSESFLFTVQLPAAETISLRLYDLTGKTIAVIYEGNYDGDEPLEIQYRNSDLAPGMYVYVLNTKTKAISKKLIVK